MNTATSLFVFLGVFICVYSAIRLLPGGWRALIPWATLSATSLVIAGLLFVLDSSAPVAAPPEPASHSVEAAAQSDPETVVYRV